MFRPVAAAALVFLGAGVCAAADVRPLVAVVPLAAADPGLPYALLPSRTELRKITDQLHAGLRGNGLSIVDESRVAETVSRAGFDQSRPDRSCSIPECAQKIGRAVGARYVVFGTVTRVEAVIWSSAVSVVDVRTGKPLREFDVVNKGDAESTEQGERHVGDCAGRVITHEKPCPVERSY
jgi:hypothetical protein